MNSSKVVRFFLTLLLTAHIPMVAMQQSAQVQSRTSNSLHMVCNGLHLIKKYAYQACTAHAQSKPVTPVMQVFCPNRFRAVFNNLLPEAMATELANRILDFDSAFTIRNEKQRKEVIIKNYNKLNNYIDELLPQFGASKASNPAKIKQSTVSVKSNQPKKSQSPKRHVVSQNDGGFFNLISRGLHWLGENPSQVLMGALFAYAVLANLRGWFPFDEQQDAINSNNNNQLGSTNNQQSNNNDSNNNNASVNSSEQNNNSSNNQPSMVSRIVNWFRGSSNQSATEQQQNNNSSTVNADNNNNNNNADSNNNSATAANENSDTSGQASEQTDCVHQEGDQPQGINNNNDNHTNNDNGNREVQSASCPDHQEGNQPQQSQQIEASSSSVCSSAQAQQQNEEASSFARAQQQNEVPASVRPERAQRVEGENQQSQSGNNDQIIEVMDDQPEQQAVQPEVQSSGWSLGGMVNRAVSGTFGWLWPGSNA